MRTCFLRTAVLGQKDFFSDNGNIMCLRGIYSNTYFLGIHISENLSTDIFGCRDDYLSIPQAEVDFFILAN